MKALISLLILLTLSSMLRAEVRDFDGSLRTLIPAIKTHMRQVAGPGSNKLVIPTTGQMQRWQAVVDAVWSQDLDTADQLLAALAPSYKVVRFTDTIEGKTYHMLLEANVTSGLTPTVVKGWGTFVFNPEPSRAMIIQVPHPIFDADTDRQGIDVFLQLGAAGFLMAGTHRCANTRASACTTGTTTACGSSAIYRESDVAHNRANMFHQTHEEIMTLTPETVAVQLHGNSGAGCPDLLISNTNNDYTTADSGYVQQLAGSLEGADLVVRLCDPRPSVCNLCGVDNMQGRFTNGSTDICRRGASSLSEQFIHIEQSRRSRQDYGALIEALQQVFPADFQSAGYPSNRRGERRGSR